MGDRKYHKEIETENETTTRDAREVRSCYYIVSIFFICYHQKYFLLQCTINVNVNTSAKHTKPSV